jgi:hypothetical protein
VVDAPSRVPDMGYISILRLLVRCFIRTVDLYIELSI